MKRILAFVLAMMMALLTLAACGEDPVTDSNTDSSSESAQASTSSDVASSDTDTENTTDSDEPDEPVKHLIALTDQRNDEIVVIDLDAADPTSDAAIVWRWNANMHGDVEYASLSKNRLDDVKLRYNEAWGGYVVAMTSSGGLVAIVSYPEGKCLWNVGLTGQGPHSIEILPNGLVVVVNSAGHTIKVFRALSKNDTSGVSLPLVGAHGVVYDPEEELIWALGDKALDAYYVGGTREDPKLNLLGDMGYYDFYNGHDLTPVFGDNNRLWVSHIGVSQFDKEKGVFDKDFDPTVAQALSGDVKSIGSFRDGWIVATRAEGSVNQTAAHNTQTVRLLYPVPAADGTVSYQMKDILFPNRDFYKVRVFVEDYQ